jgi:hypothetical protein
MTDSPKAFSTFYRDVFLPEHQQPLNVALHILGTLAGLVWIAATLAAPGFWKLAVLLFPVIHGAPGLIGHRLVERSEAVGDARWARRDYPAWLFILANHRLTAERLVIAPVAALARGLRLASARLRQSRGAAR